MADHADPTTLRPYCPDDAPALLGLFRATVRQVNARDYSPEQVDAWASDAIDPAAWAARFEGRFALVAEASGRPVGFVDMEDDGHIDRFFVTAERQRRGVGRALLAAVEAEARRRGLARLSAEVSLTARPFFESLGFAVLAAQVVVVRGVAFDNFRMERALPPLPGP